MQSFSVWSVFSVDSSHAGSVARSAFLSIWCILWFPPHMQSFSVWSVVSLHMQSFFRVVRVFRGLFHAGSAARSALFEYFVCFVVSS